MTCEGFRTRLHFRDELSTDERRGFDRHAAGCRPCAQILLEAERLDDLLLQWSAPESAAASSGGLSFGERVMKSVRGEGPMASCAETTASLHHFVAGDLEPWLAARVERHLAKCRDCADHLDEVGHSRRVWLTWKAPDPRDGFADELIRRLEPETRAARRRRQFVDLLFGAVPVPRAVAALVLASVTLLSVGVLQMERPGATHGSPSVIEHPTTAEMPASMPVLPADYHYLPAGRGDPTDSLSPDVRGGRADSLRYALRGEDDSAQRTPRRSEDGLEGRGK
jgi:anti-sigma factor RsiW